MYMTQDPTGRYMAVVVRGKADENNILLYNAWRPEAGPLTALPGNSVQSFFVRGDFSYDGQHYACGSSDGTVRLWDLTLGLSQLHRTQPVGLT